MDDDNKNIFDVLGSPSPSTGRTNDLTTKSTRTITSTSTFSMRRSHLPLMNAGNGFHPTSSSSPISSTKQGRPKQIKRKDKLHDLDFANPGPKNLVNVANVPSRRTKTRQPTAQEKPSTSKPLYDEYGRLASDQTDRCDCNRLKCPGCFVPCSNCQSPKCGLECQYQMLVRKPHTKKKPTSSIPAVASLDSSLTSIEWLPNMQIGENTSPASGSATPTTINPGLPVKHALPVTTSFQHKIEATEVETPTTAIHDNVHHKPPYSYVTLIRQAILSTRLRRMTLNEIYQWIVDSYPYFRTAPPKWKNSIRHNLSLNKCFKRLQRSTNDPGKGSYWAVDDACDNNNQITTRKRKFEETQASPHILPSSPATLIQQPPGMHTNNNPMICGDITSIGGQSSSTDESDSTTSLTANPNFPPWDDLNIDLTASFRRFREQVLDAPLPPSISHCDGTSGNPGNINYWNPDFLPNVETNSFFESVKLASSGEINWNDIDVKPYFPLLDGFIADASFQSQDRDKLINLATSLSSFFDYTGITNMAQSRIASESLTMNRMPMGSNRTTSESISNHSNPLPSVLEEEPQFDWDSIA